MSEEAHICRECKYHKRRVGSSFFWLFQFGWIDDCLHPRVANVVTGESKDCKTERMDLSTSICRRSGTLWEAKKPEPFGDSEIN